MFFQSLKTKIVVSTALVLLLAVLLTDFVVIGIVENHLILARIDQARHRLSLFGEHAGGSHADRSMTVFRHDVAGWAYHLSGRKARYALGTLDSSIQVAVRQLTLEVEATGTPSVRNSGDTWGVFLKRKKFLIVSDPLWAGNRVAGAGTLVIDLDDTYRTLRKSQKNILLYLIANLAILLFLGSYRIFRLVFKPIQKMIRITQGYSETEPLYFLPQKRHHEFNRLATALNQMIQRIEADRDRLKESLASLKAANTELRKAQQNIIRAEKLASVGRLAAGVAHEIGNPIGVVLGYLGLLRKGSVSQKDAAGRDYIDRAEAEINRINLVIRQLLDFSRASTVQPAALSVHQLIKDAVDSMTHHPIMAGIQIVCDLPAPEDRVYGDADRLRQVLLNLMINAADAISVSGGRSDSKIRIMTGVEAPADDQRMFKLMVADNGAGIPKEDIDNIFDPFYTTKEPGKGTGLGLSVSYMIIEQMGGDIVAESEPGKGTTMIIRIPMCEENPVAA